MRQTNRLDLNPISVQSYVCASSNYGSENVAVTQETKAIDAVYEALCANPNSSVNALIEITNFGKSTVSQQLRALEAKGLVIRSKPDKRAPETWSAKAKRSPSRKDRLAKGELRAQVFNYLVKNAGEAFTPTQISKRLRRSSGAITNAVVRLTEEDGGVEQVGDHPRRYAFTEG